MSAYFFLILFIFKKGGSAFKVTFNKANMNLSCYLQALQYLLGVPLLLSNYDRIEEYCREYSFISKFEMIDLPIFAATYP